MRASQQQLKPRVSLVLGKAAKSKKSSEVCAALPAGVKSLGQKNKEGMAELDLLDSKDQVSIGEGDYPFFTKGKGALLELKNQAIEQAIEHKKKVMMVAALAAAFGGALGWPLGKLKDALMGLVKEASEIHGRVLDEKREIFMGDADQRLEKARRDVNEAIGGAPAALARGAGKSLLETSLEASKAIVESITPENVQKAIDAQNPDSGDILWGYD